MTETITVTGHGFDVHAFAAGRPLILGGVAIPHDAGLAGHSDADVLTHAVCDAILGAACLSDIGEHFPDTDPAYRGADSLKLLAECVAKAAALGGRLVHVDATAAAQAPKLSSHKPAMRARLEAVCGCPVNVKATTTERLGFVGRKEGIAAYATATLTFPAGALRRVEG